MEQVSAGFLVRLEPGDGPGSTSTELLSINDGGPEKEYHRYLDPPGLLIYKLPRLAPAA